MPITVLVTGATGFIGSRLVPALQQDGHEVRAMTRHPGGYTGPARPVYGDVNDPDSLADALRGVAVAYYLVHSLDSADFEQRDAQAARNFGAAAAAAGVRRIIYLGGLGEQRPDVSAHLRSRREVETLLGDAGVPVTVLRAAVVIGHGGISWEMTRQLVDHLPIMIAPRWVRTRTQPIALPDVIRYLVGVLQAPEATGQVYEIGGPEVLRYADMLKRVARIQNHRRLPVITLALLTPRLSSLWLQWVTDVDVRTARHLVDSMTTEVVAGDHRIQAVVPGGTLGYDDSIRLALAERHAARAQAAAGEAGPALRRRRVVVAITLVVGAMLLGLSLTAHPGAGRFYWGTAALAATWSLGGVVSGPLHLGRVTTRGARRRPVLGPLLLGAAAAAVFLGGALLVRQIGPLRDLVVEVLDHARRGSLPLVALITAANGVAEEIFFRGAVFAAFARSRPVLGTTVIYTLATVATGNPMLAFAAIIVGTLFALQRRESGGVLASGITHVTWSLILLLALPSML